MQIYKNLNFNSEKKTVLALGSFDAYHIAHIELISKAVSYASENGLKVGIYQFVERPDFVLNPSEDNKNLYTNEKKEQFAKECGVDFLYFEKFDCDFMKMAPEDFVLMLLSKFNIKCVVVGFDYRFGYKGAGDSAEMKRFGEKYGFETIILPPVKIEDTLVSSTHIRNLLFEGNIFEANRFLGRAYSIRSTVFHDRGVGRKIGFPTANIAFDDKTVVPKEGVYATFVEIEGKKYASVTNIGTRPTFNLNKKSIESYILDFNEDIYAKSIELFFLGRIRNEIKFENSKQLKSQILSDINKSKEYFEHYLEKKKLF